MSRGAYEIELGSRCEQWLGFLERQVLRYSLSEMSDRSERFAINARGRAAGDWRIGRVRTSGGQCQLTRGPVEIAADQCGGYILYLPLGSQIGIEQFGRSVTCGPSAFALAYCGEKLNHMKLGNNDTVYLAIPQGFFERRLKDPDRHCSELVSSCSGIANLAKNALLALERQASALTDDELPAAAAAVCELIALALQGRGELASGISSVRAGNLARAKRLIRAQLSDPGLRPGDIARACGISVSYLHNLFRDDGRTMGAFLLEERLARTRTLLANGQVLTVTEAALDCGFSNMSSFSTSFRAEFGAPPRDVLHRRDLH